MESAEARKKPGNPTVSVVLAAFRGERFLRAQVDSILPQLAPGDELILSVQRSGEGASEDGTAAVAAACAAEDSRIRLLTCEEAGAAAHFGFALGHVAGDIVFLADQDDVWLPGKVERILACFADPSVSAVVHGCVETDGELRPLPHQRPLRARRIRQGEILLRNPVRGCCLALRREVLSDALPIPRCVPMHDSWLGLVSCRHGRVLFLPERLLMYRRHGGNLSPDRHQAPGKMLRDRAGLLRALWQSRRPHH